MGLHDRQFMKRRSAPPAASTRAQTKAAIPKPARKASLWKRLLFRLWLLFRRGE